MERKCRFNFTDLLEDVEKEAKQDKQLTESKEIIRELLKYIFTPEGFESLSKKTIKKAEAFINKE